MSMSDNLLTIKETAEYLKVHWQTVRLYIKKGELKYYRVGRNIRIRESSLEDFLEKRKSRDRKVEIEIRFVNENRKRLEKKLLNLGAEIIYHGHIIDHWYIPNSIKSMKEKDIWFDNAKGYGLRIREQDNGYTGKIQTSLEIKKLLKPGKHDTCLEAEIDVDNYDETSSLLRLMNLKKMITIDKDRVVYRYKKYKIVLDDIKDFKNGVEIELITDREREEVIPELKKVAADLGLDLKRDMTDKSVTYLAMKKLANF